jgi:prophage regulatory protein
MTDRFLKRDQVEALCGLSKATLYRWIKQQRFPRPIQVGSTAVRWRESDIRAWQEERVLQQTAA